MKSNKSNKAAENALPLEGENKVDAKKVKAATIAAEQPKEETMPKESKQTLKENYKRLKKLLKSAKEVLRKAKKKLKKATKKKNTEKIELYKNLCAASLITKDEYKASVKNAKLALNGMK